MKNYSETLNLPKTNFSMKADLANNEERFIEKWNRNKIYFKSLKGKNEFILHDGPPYANSPIHLGTAFNKILKDTVIKYKRLKGFKAEFIPGWDTHGLPIELAVIKSMGKEILSETDEIALRDRFRKHAERYIEHQKADFKRLGILADWDNPYITMDPKFESAQLEVFANLVDNGYVYNALKPVYWCTETRTALAESEIIYKNHISDSIFFKCKASEKTEKQLNVKNLYFAIWTTTPWTLPANLAIALNSEMNYVVVYNGKENLIIATDLVDALKEKLNIQKIVSEPFLGKTLEYHEYYHPFLERKGIVVLGDHVTSTSGTGCVHTAPGHGIEDYLVGKKYELDILSPVNEKGCLIIDGILNNVFYKDANKIIMDELLKENLLFAHKIEHSYPYSDRGNAPIIFRATKQWFISISGSLRDIAVEEIKRVNFFPAYSVNRLIAMINNRPDWCISRQRVWGVPIPVFYCKDCDKAILDSKVIRDIAKEVYTKGTDVFIQQDPNYFLKNRHKCCKNNFERGKDIFDVWFDSGITYESVLKERVADLYLEGSDQHRGWFQTSLLTSVGSRGRAPFKNIMTHGFVVDGNGNKMSKSVGNVIVPQEVIKKYGADILRLWALSVDFAGDVKISDDILKQNVENYRKIRNSFRFILSNIYSMNENVELLEIDKLALNRLNKLVIEVDEMFSQYQFHNGITEVINFITEMSAFYFDIVKDRLYVEKQFSRERSSAQIVLKKIGIELSKMLSPILSFTMEEIWEHLHTVDHSIFLEQWPIAEESKDLSVKWNQILHLRDIVNSAVEFSINNGVIKKSQEALLELKTEIDLDMNLSEIFKVAEVKIEKGNETKALIKTFNGVKCERCWLYYTTIDGEVCKKCKQVLRDV